MIKIIKRGVVPTRYRGTCPNCCCQFECTQEHVSLGSDGIAGYTFVSCPSKGCGTDVPVEKIEHVNVAAADMVDTARLDRQCSNVLRFLGEKYPRTCAQCGLGSCNDPEGMELQRRMETETAGG